MEEKNRDAAPGSRGGGAKDDNHGAAAKEATSTKKKARKGPALIGAIILIVLIAAGLVVGTLWLIDTVTFVSTDDASIDGNHVNVSAKMLGRIHGITAVEGAKVQAGQVLVTLEDGDLRAQETQASAALNYAKQNAVLAKINLDKTQDDYQRVHYLFNTGSTTKEQYDHAGKALESANAQYTIAQAQVETANAQLGVIETQLLNTRISAPISGVVAKKFFMQGDVVQPGQTIVSVSDLDNVWVTANFEETKIGRIRVDAPVEIAVDAFRDRQFRGRVAMIGAAIVAPPFSIGEFTKTTQRVPVKIVFDAIPGSVTLLPGMSVEVKVRTQ